MTDQKTKVLAVASGGGHWVQLLRLRTAFQDCDVTFVTTNRNFSADVPGERLLVVPDSNFSRKLALVRTALAVLLVLIRERPRVVVSTGAAPGYFAVRLGKWFGARTIWVDSVANAETLSMCGAKIGSHADLWLTQWAHLARSTGPFFRGSVL